MLGPFTAMKTTQSHFGTLASCGLALAIAWSIASVGQPSALAQSHRLQPSMEARSAFATSIETQMRQGGIDAQVQLEGDQRDQLRVQWNGVNSRNIYAFVTSNSVRNTVGVIGFKTIVFTHGTQRWEYDVARESMVWSSSQPE
jgi:hypothetical protein